MKDGAWWSEVNRVAQQTSESGKRPATRSTSPTIAPPSSTAMTNKPSRTSTPIPTTPTTPPPSTTERSKLPKFLQSARRRGAGGGSGSSGGGAADDRGGVRTDPESRASVSSAGTSSAGSSRLSTVSAPAAPIQIPETPARGSRLASSPFDAGGSRDDDSPVLVEPTPRTRRGDPATSLYTPSSANRLGELPTRLSGWFSNAFGGSASDLSLPALLTHAAVSAPSGSPASPRARASPHALLVAAKHGKGQIDKAMRYLLDSDATPDNCPDPIWLLGVLHPSRAPSPALSPALSDAPRGSAEFRRAARAAARGSNESLATRDTLAHAASQLVPKHPGAHWPPAFYADFSTRIWCTYRSGFPPIRDSALSALEREIGSGVQDMLSTSPTSRRWWGGEKGWTNDTGWGCMLRTGQSLLANALLHMELGRGISARLPPFDCANIIP
jgi:cysteine protease ATG4